MTTTCLVEKGGGRHQRVLRPKSQRAMRHSDVEDVVPAQMRLLAQEVGRIDRRSVVRHQSVLFCVVEEEGRVGHWHWSKAGADVIAHPQDDLVALLVI